MVWAEVYAGGIGGFIARLRPEVEPPPHAARRQYLAWCREQRVPWDGHDHDYGTRGRDEHLLIADDADVAVIAAHASRMAVDLLARPNATAFPHSAYVIGLSKDWIFGEPFDTRPVDFVADGEWRQVLPERAVEALDFMSSLFEHGEHAD
jgi:sulfur-carrier protein adenylyltransferase/sulfurtransferase